MTKKEKKAKKRLKREKKMWGGMTKEELYSFCPMMIAFATATNLNIDAIDRRVGNSTTIRVNRSGRYYDCPTFESTGASQWSTADSPIKNSRLNHNLPTIRNPLSADRSGIHVDYGAIREAKVALTRWRRFAHEPKLVIKQIQKGVVEKRVLADAMLYM